MSDRLRATVEANKRHAWKQGDTDGAYAMVAEAFQLDLSTEDGRRKADEYIALADPDAVYGPDMAMRIREKQRVKNYIAQAEKENEQERGRLELKRKEDQEKREQTARVLAKSYEAERTELSQKRGIEYIDCNTHDPT